MKEGGKNGAILLERERERERETDKGDCLYLLHGYLCEVFLVHFIHSIFQVIPQTLYAATQNRHNSRYVLSTDPKLCIHIAQIFTSTFRIS